MFFTILVKANRSLPSANLIQLAILLDTSNSMDGLIDQAKSQLWNIVNEVADARKNGDDVNIEIGLYEYGNDRISAYENHLKLVVPFTTDMDLISESLFALTTNGGQEFCGAVIHKSIDELEWNSNAGLKAIYIAGNESFRQGPYAYEKSCKEAMERKIAINSIFCGDQENGVNLSWNIAPSLTNGSYSSINHNTKTVHIETPFDFRIMELNTELNKTYISFTQKGEAKRLNQLRQDSNASSYGQSNASKRAIYKSKSNYNNSSWDLVDAHESGKDVFKNKKELPKAYQNLSDALLEKEIERLSRKRIHIKQEISCLAKQRERFIENLKAEKEVSNPLEESILSPLRKQLKQNGFEVK